MQKNYSLEPYCLLLFPLIRIDEKTRYTAVKQMTANRFRVRRIESETQPNQSDRNEHEIGKLTWLTETGNQNEPQHIEIIIENPLDAANDAPIVRRHRLLIDLHESQVEHPQAEPRRNETDEKGNHGGRVRITTIWGRLIDA